MGKTKRKWIELDFTNPNALRAQDIPYNALLSVKDAIDSGLTGPTGPQGPQSPFGPQGPQGDPMGPMGYQGFQGPKGPQGSQGGEGPQGTGDQGPEGPQGFQGMGPQGFQGISGSQGGEGPQGAGEQGPEGPQGNLGGIGPQGPDGFGFQGPDGPQGVQGPFGGPPGPTGSQGDMGPQGFQGLIGPQGNAFTRWSSISRYAALTTAGEEVWIVSSSTVYAGVIWDRTDTTLTMYRGSHGHSVGNAIIVRNTNMDYQVGYIDGTTVDSFRFITTDVGSIYDTDGAYSLGFTYAHVGSPHTGGTLAAPTGDHADAQLMSMRIRTGARFGSTYDIEVPASAVNGAGQNTSLADCYVPEYTVRNDSDLLAAVGATMVTNISGSYSTFEMGSLGSLSRIITMHF